MKQKLLFFTALFVTYIAFAQVPANDLIENATLIDPTNYLEENIRLDLTTDSGVAAMDCSTVGFPKVYYKFTANADITISSGFSDMNGNAISNGFVIFYTAPNLLQTDESQLSSASACAFSESTTITLTSGQDYYISVYRGDANVLTKFTSNVPPPNDAIENAIEITGSSYYDQDVRLDLAAANLGGQVGCDLGTLPLVYYKFTALTSGQASVFLSSNVTLGNTFAIFYTASDLNATDNNQLTLASVCSFGTQSTNFNIVEGQSYYLLVHHDTPDVSTNVSITIPQDGTPEERQALIDLYNATDGPNWPFNDGWNTAAPLSAWTNVTVENGHVTAVVIATFGVSGTLPSSLSNLTFLETADFRSNNLFGEVPDLSGISTLEVYDVNYNNFSVGDLVTNFTNNSTLSDFRYTTQTTIDPEIQFEPALGTDYTLSVTPDSDANASYQWFKERTSPDVNIPINGATSASYDIINVQSDDLDRYICEITGTAIPDLIIRRLPINLTGPVSQQERDALIAFYNATDGDNWTDNTNWLSTEPVGTWSFITTRGNKVIRLNIFGDAGLNGQLPDEIGDLINLEMLSIGIEENLIGELPSSIGNLSELQRLRFQLTGNTGALPSSVGNLSNLWEIRIAATGMTGELPSSLGNLSNLTDLTLFGERVFAGNGQSFSGTIPASLGNLTSLNILDLSGNSFSGEVPTSLSNITNLLSLRLNDNDLVGSLPDLSGNVNPNRVVLVQNNFYDFSNLEPLVNNGLDYAFLEYSPQRTLDQEESIESPTGVDITLDVNDTGLDRENTEQMGNGNVYQWFKDNEALPGANANTYTIFNAQEIDSGVYYCEITNALVPDLIIRRANITVIVDEELSTIENETNAFMIYPNPVTNWLTINLGNQTDANITIHDVNGKLVLEQNIEANIQATDVSQLQSGMYLITISSNEKTITKRFIKQ